MKHITASKASDLSEILDFVHDRAYELDRIAFDRDARELRIPIKLNDEGLVCTLIIRAAQDYSVVDKAEIGEGDINTIVFSEGKVLIKGAIPVDITVRVDQFDVELVLPPNAPVA